jgi:hypothetical protein
MGKRVQCCDEWNAVPNGPGALHAGSRYSTRVGAVVADVQSLHLPGKMQHLNSYSNGDASTGLWSLKRCS